MKILRYVSDKRGLTLVELMIVMVLSLMLMAAVFLTYQLQSGSGQAEMRKTAIQQDLRAIMEVITLDIMHAGLDPSRRDNIVGIPADVCNRGTLRVVMDLNGNGTTTNAVSDAEENITYRLTGTNLERVSNNAGITRVLSNNVIGFSFTYRDSNFQDITPAGNNSLTAALVASVRYIDVSVTLQDRLNDVQTGEAIARTLSRTVCRRD